MNRSSFTERHPYWFVVMMEAVVITGYLLAGTVTHFVGLSNRGLYGLANLGLTAIAILILTAMGWWKKVGFRAPDRRGDLWYYVVPFLPAAINLIPGLQLSGRLFLVATLAITLMVGFVEETYFRGLMLNALKSKGLWQAAIITSVLFGGTHTLNLLAGKSVAEAVAQVYYAMAIGFAYAALVLRKGILWPLVLAHFLIDFVFFMQTRGFTYPPLWELLITVGIASIFTAYGLFVMLQKDRAPALQTR